MPIDLKSKILNKFDSMFEKKIIFCVLTVLFATNIFGETPDNTQKKDTTLRREMLLEGEYTPVIQDANKVNILPPVEDPMPVKATIEYSPWSITTYPETEFANLQAEHFGTEPMLYDKRGYVTFGGGNYMNIKGAAGSEVLNSESDYLRISGNHFSTNGDVKYLQDNSSEKAKLNDNLFNAFYKHRFEYFDLKTEVNYGYTGFNFYGYNKFEDPNATIPNKAQVHQLINPSVGIKSTHDGGINYEAQISYSYFMKKFGQFNGDKGLKENNICTTLDLNKELESTTIGFSADVDYFSYQTSQYESDIDNHTHVSLTPYFEMEEKDKWKLHVGANLVIASEGDNKFTVAPDFLAEYSISKDTWLYLHAEGGKKDYSAAYIAKENRYLNPGIKVEDSYAPIDGRFGIKSSALDKWFFNAYFRYQNMQDNHFYYRTNYDISGNSTFANAFEYGLYDKSNLMQVGGEISFNHQDKIGVSLQLAKNFWDTELSIDGDKITKPINAPDFDVNASIDVAILPQLKANVGFDWQSGRYGLLGDYTTSGAIFSDLKAEKMKDIQNLTLGANYNFNKSFSIYVQLNNLLNRKYEYWYTYPEQGISAMAGFSFMF